MTGTRKLRVFISHASEDNPVARALNDQLEAEPWIDPWLDEDDLFPGHQWDLEIENAIQVADVILICLSHKSVHKEGYIQKEYKRALALAEEKPEGTIFIIPLLLDDCVPPRSFDRWQRAKYSSEDDYKKLLVSLRLRANSLSLERDAQPKREGAPAGGSERPQQRRPGFKAVVKMFLGFTLPGFACILIFAAAGARKYFDGVWMTSTNEVIFTLLIFFGLLILSFILFVDGVGQITASTFQAGSRFSRRKQIISVSNGASTRERFNRQLEALRGAIKTFQTKENWLEPEFTARLKAALQSLLIPGWGLYVRGRKGWAAILFLATTVGYFIEFMPGILLHLITIVLSGVMDPPVETTVLDQDPTGF